MYTAAELRERDDEPVEDHIVVLRGVTWADFQRLLEIRGDHSAPRLAYLEGAVEIMTPSRPHESIKGLIGRLVEAWCLERGIEFETLGSWTLEEKAEERGIEPDECYVFGLDRQDATRPDLAIEVVWTHGGLNKLEIYRKLGVREVWYWRKGAITLYCLRGDRYDSLPASEVLPGIDLERIASLVGLPTSQAIRAFRAAIR